MTMGIPSSFAAAPSTSIDQRAAPREVISAISPRGGMPYCDPRFDGDPMPDNDCADGYDMKAFPEALLGVHCPTNEPNVRDKRRAIRGILSDLGSPQFSVLSMDFNMVGPVGQLRAALKTMMAVATFNIVRFVGVIAATSNTITAPAAGFPTSIGVRLEWGVGLTSYAPFAMTITTVGLLNLFGAGVLDRLVTVRVRDINGGEIFLPWGHRPTGMSMAQIQVGNAAAGATITASGLPAAIAAAFSWVGQFLTPFSPLTAQYISAVGALDCSGRRC
jgi:hypothetical protein